MNKKARFDNLPCFPQMSFRKRGWLLILEATIAVLIVSGVLIAVYSQQVDRRVDLVDYYNDLQGQILADVSMRSDLRLNVLNVVEEDFGDGNFTRLNDFIGGKIPEGFGYSIRVCDLGDETDFCKMRAPIFIATMDKDIYVEEIVVSAEIGSGTDAVYNPKKLKLFVWEGEAVAVDCENECPSEGTIFGCSEDGDEITKRTCGNFDMDFCLEWNGTDVEYEACNGTDECVDELGICVEEVEEPSGEGTEDNPFLVNNLEIDVRFASQGVGEYDDDDGVWLGRPSISINGVKVGETTGYGSIFEAENLELVEGKNVVELYSNWNDNDGCGESPSFDAVLAVLRIDDNYVLQTDESWSAMLEGGWSSSPYQSYLKSDDGGCYMGSGGGTLINFPWTSSEKCVNSRACDNCCLTRVKKEFWVHKVAEECVDECSADVYSCDGDNAKVLVRECEDSDKDGCLELGDIKVYYACGTGKMCVAGSTECVSAVASLSASYVMGTTAISGGYTYYYYTSTISETSGGVGVTINSRQKCYDSVGCDPVKYTITTDYGTNHISPGGQISDPANYWFTSYSPDRITETFWGIDDNGNPVSASLSMNHPS